MIQYFSFEHIYELFGHNIVPCCVLLNKTKLAVFQSSFGEQAFYWWFIKIQLDSITETNLDRYQLIHFHLYCLDVSTPVLALAYVTIIKNRNTGKNTKEKQNKYCLLDNSK